MYIYWLGESSFKIKTDEATVVIDPGAKNTGLPQITTKAEVVILSHTIPTDIDRVQSSQDTRKLFVIQQPGEYEVKGVFVYGLPGDNKSVLYLLKMEDIEIAHLAGLTRTLNDKQLELFEGVDIVTIPVGGNGVLSHKEADEVVSQLEPRIVIPMNYSVPSLATKRDSVDGFLTLMGAKELAPETSLYITKAKLPQEETRIVLLQLSPC